MSEPPPFGAQRDRRRRKRRLTKRNILIGFVSLFVLFLGISVWSEVSDKAKHGKGRLYSGRLNVPELPERQPYEVVPGDEIGSSSGANPMLLEYSRREQILGVEPGMLERQYGINPDAPLLDPNDSSLTGIAGSNRVETGTADVAITGGPEGVRIEKKQ